MRCFEVLRVEDESGVSGTGHVADAVEFDDGTFVIRWRAGKAGRSSTGSYSSYDDALAIHGHGGKTFFRERS